MCQQEYPAEHIRVVDQLWESQLIHLACASCNNAMLAVVVATQTGLSSIGMVTDLDLLDALRIRGKAPMTLDNVLEFHSLIRMTPHTLTRLLTSSL